MARRPRPTAASSFLCVCCLLASSRALPATPPADIPLFASPPSTRLAERSIIAPPVNPAALFDPPRLAAALPLRPGFEPAAESETAAPAATAESDPSAKSSGPAADKASADSEKKAEEKIGPAPPTDTLDFFRQSSVLLNKGVLEVEWGLQYSLLESDFLAILPDSNIVPEQLVTRSFLGTFSVRYGWTKRLQPFFTLPLGVGHIERADQANRVADSTYGPGDILFGASYLLRDGCDERADLVLNVNAAAPLGAPSLATVQPTFAPLGSGFWSVGASLTATRTFDPVVLFGTVGYAHQFDREFFGVNIEPGEELNYAFGAGFAVNDELTFSTQYQSIAQFDTEIAGVRLADSGLEASTLRFSAIVRLHPQHFLEAFVFDGLTNAAPSTTCGLLGTRRF